MAVLVALARKPGIVVKKEELLATVWQGRFVSDEVLTHAIWQLRRALRDDARKPSVIATHPREGYRLIVSPEVSKDERNWKPLLLAALPLSFLLLLAGAAAWLRPSPSVPVDIRVVVTDTLDLSSAGDLAFAVNELFMLALEEREGLKPVPRTRLLDRVEDGGSVTATVARQFARDNGLHNIVALSLEEDPNGFLLKAATEFQGKKVSFQESFTEPQHVFDRIELLAAAVRGVQKPHHLSIRSSTLAQQTSRSIEAVSRYARASRLHQSGSLGAAALLFEDAIRLDPDFALAHNRLALIRSGQGAYAASLRHSQLAFDLRDGVGERQRHHIEAAYHGLRYQYQTASNALEMLTLLNSEDSDALRRHALVLERRGRLRSALAKAKMAAELAPKDVLARGLYPLLLATSNDPKSALTEIDLARKALGDHAYLLWAEVVALQVMGDLDAAREAAQRLMATDPTYATTGHMLLAQIEMQAGDLASAEAALALGLRLNTEEGFDFNAASARYWLARIALEHDQLPLAEQHLRWIRKIPHELGNLRMLRRIARLLIEMKLFDEAQQVAEILQRLATEHPSGLASGIVAEIQAVQLLARGDPAAAVLELNEAISLLPDYQTFLTAARVHRGLGDCATSRRFLREIALRRAEVLRDEAALDLRDAARLFESCGEAERPG